MVGIWQSFESALPEYNSEAVLHMPTFSVNYGGESETVQLLFTSF
jgi:hypothetical protein